jgi:hypothetical protein
MEMTEMPASASPKQGARRRTWIAISVAIITMFVHIIFVIVPGDLSNGRTLRAHDTEHEYNLQSVRMYYFFATLSITWIKCEGFSEDLFQVAGHRQKDSVVRTEIPAHLLSSVRALITEICILLEAIWSSASIAGFTTTDSPDYSVFNDRDTRFIYCAVELFKGWPLRSYRGQIIYSLSMDSSGELVSVTDLHELAVSGLSSRQSQIYSIGQHRKILSGIPYQIRLWPFLLNTMLYAAVILVAFRLYIFVKHSLNRGRGLCPSCGYVLSGLTRDVCPECGQKVSCAKLRRM